MNNGLVIPADPKLREANRKANAEADRINKQQPQRAVVRHKKQEQGKQQGSRRVFLAPTLGSLAHGFI